MPRKFATQREIDFVNNIAKEVIQKVVGQEVIYYAILPDQTQFNDLYQEAVRKTWAKPVRVNALVRYDNLQEKTVAQGQDEVYQLEVYFHRKELDERNLVPRAGDFVEFGQVFYEISSVTQPQMIFGQVNNLLMKKCMCVPSREGQFAAGGETFERVDNTHPRENAQQQNNRS